MPAFLRASRDRLAAGRTSSSGSGSGSSGDGSHGSHGSRGTFGTRSRTSSASKMSEKAAAVMGVSAGAGAGAGTGTAKIKGKAKSSGSSKRGQDAKAEKRGGSGGNGGDPLAGVTAPPARESASEREARLGSESLAKKRSEEIDKWLKADHADSQRERNGEIQLALLGQSGAGKTTLLKQMRLLYDPEAHERERQSWRLVVYLNIITATRLLLEAVEHVLEERDAARDAAHRAAISSGAADIEEKLGAPDGGDAPARAPWGLVGAGESAVSRSSSHASLSSLARAGSAGTNASSGRKTPGSGRSRTPSKETLLIRLRLAPLLSLEQDLRTRLGAVDDGAADPHISAAHPSWRGAAPADARAESAAAKPKRRDDLVLKAGWQDRAVDTAVASTGAGAAARSAIRASIDALPADQSDALANRLRQREEDDPTALVLACKDDIAAVWSGKSSDVFAHGDIVRKLRKRFEFERVGAPVWFLDHLARISRPDYAPTNEDIMHARVRTVGVHESVFNVTPTHRYRVYDVGGERSQRIAWAPFLSGAVRAIIFVAPVGAYDQRLLEDPSVNRVQDSLDLFWQVATNKLLLGSSLVLLLNKIDLLQEKVRRGVSVKEHWPKYDGSDADHEQVWRWFRARFTDVANASRGKLRSDAHRPVGQVYIFPSCAVDSGKIKAILLSVQDTILRSNLKDIGFF